MSGVDLVPATAAGGYEAERDEGGLGVVLGVAGGSLSWGTARQLRPVLPWRTHKQLAARH